jgi:Zn ribbon nucleic-acid-binding protein
MIVCPKCGAKDAYYTEMKANNEVARCLECSAFIKNIPHSEPTFYFGKYKDKKVSEVTDADYLKWVLANTKQSKNMRDAIEQKIASLPQHN